MDEDGNQWIQRSGSDESVCLLGDGTESSQTEGQGLLIGQADYLQKILWVIQCNSV